MYMAFLEWIRPTDGNAELCWKLKNVIKRIVDSALEIPVQLPEAGGDGASDPIAIGDWDDLNWLNTIDWTQGDWLDMNEASF
jgi:hypothetical protein